MRWCVSRCWWPTGLRGGPGFRCWRRSARAVDHPRLASLYVIASLCYTTGRIEAAVRYCDAGQIVLGRSREALPYGSDALLGAAYLAIGQPERLAEWCRAQLARRRDTH